MDCGTTNCAPLEPGRDDLTERTRVGRIRATSWPDRSSSPPPVPGQLRQGRRGARLSWAHGARVAAVFTGRRRRCVGRKREGGATPEVGAGPLRLQLGGLLVLGLVAGAARAARLARGRRSRGRDFPPRRSPASRLIRCSRWPPPSIPWPRSITSMTHVT